MAKFQVFLTRMVEEIAEIEVEADTWEAARQQVFDNDPGVTLAWGAGSECDGIQDASGAVVYDWDSYDVVALCREHGIEFRNETGTWQWRTTDAVGPAFTWVDTGCVALEQAARACREHCGLDDAFGASRLMVGKRGEAADAVGRRGLLRHVRVPSAALRAALRSR